MKRKHPELTEQEIIERIKLGSLVVDFDNQQILSVTPCGKHALSKIRKIPHALTIRLCGRTTKYPCIRVKWNGKRRNIPCHILAWLAYTLDPIPEGYEVHHGSEGPLVWHPRNLECLTYEEHRRRHSMELEEEFT